MGMPESTPKILSELRAVPFQYEDDIAGIYFLVYKDLIVYIGTSNDIFNRVRAHKKMSKKFTRVFVDVFKNTKYMNYWECHYIHMIEPFYNIKGNRSRPDKNADLDTLYDELLKTQQLVDFSDLYIDTPIKIGSRSFIFK